MDEQWKALIRCFFIFGLFIGLTVGGLIGWVVK